MTGESGTGAEASGSEVRRMRGDGPVVIAAAVVGLAALVVRAVLYWRVPIVLTNDSPDYLLASAEIIRSFDFFSDHLRDWRLPGYPVFLAVVRLLAGWSAPTIVMTQKLLGLLSGVLAGLVLWRLELKPAALVLGAFVALNPPLLFVEHLAMSESLFVLLLWSFLAVCAVAPMRRLGLGRGLVVGALSGVCVLTRASGLFFCAPIVLCMVAISVSRDSGDSLSRLRRVSGFVVGVLVGSGLLIGAWMLRNLAVSGELTLTGNSQRNRVVYLAMHGLLDSRLPLIDSLSFDGTDLREAGYELISQLGSGARAERRARSIVREQIGARPGRYASEVGRSLLHFWGLPVSDPPPGSEDLRNWVYRFADDPAAVAEQNRIVLAAVPELGIRYVSEGTRWPWLSLWRQVAVLYLSHGRGVLSLLFVACLVAFSATGGHRLVNPQDGLVTLVGLGTLVSAASHSLLLADFDRYAMPWDGFQMLVVVVVGGDLVRRLRARYSD